MIFKKCNSCIKRGACPFAAVFTKLIEGGTFSESILRKTCMYSYDHLTAALVSGYRPIDKYNMDAHKINQSLSTFCQN